MTIDCDYVTATRDAPENGTEDAFDDFLERFYAWFDSLSGEEAFEILKDGNFNFYIDDKEEEEK